MEQSIREFITTQGERFESAVRYNECRVLLNLKDALSLNKELYNHLLREPDTALRAVSELLRALYGFNPQIGFFGPFGENNVRINDLTHAKLGQLVSLHGVVTSVSVTRARLERSVHYCPQKSVFYEKIYVTDTAYPTTDADGDRLVSEFGYSDFKDVQRATLQLAPEETTDTARSVSLQLEHDLTNLLRPGDRVTVSGVYRSVNTPQEFKAYVDVSSVQKRDTDLRISEEELSQIHDLLSRKDVLDVVSQSIAPSIYGLDHVKRGLLLMLLGGNEHDLNGMRIRGDTNALLCGDPSTAKSQLARFCSLLLKSVVTTARSATGVGLTAAVVVDPETHEKRLEAGAMVLADRGLVVIDEFDKMSIEDRSALHEAMEQQTVTVSKAGIHSSLNARCSVLACANPVYQKYDVARSVAENTGLPDSLLSRFDLVYSVVDRSNPQIDRRIAEFILFQPPVDSLPVELLSKMIFYVRRRMRPVLNDEARSAVISAYVRVRAQREVTPRVLETLIRLSTAHAKLRLSDVVEPFDVETACSVYSESVGTEYSEAPRRPPRETKSTKDAQQKRETTKDEFDFTTEGFGVRGADAESVTLATIEEQLKETLYTMSRGSDSIFTYTSVYSTLKEQCSCTEAEFQRVLRKLEKENRLMWREGLIVLI